MGFNHLGFAKTLRTPPYYGAHAINGDGCYDNYQLNEFAGSLYKHLVQRNIAITSILKEMRHLEMVKIVDIANSK